MSIQGEIGAAIKSAMLAKEKEKLLTLRMLSAALKQIEVDKKVEITDELAILELTRQVKQRQEAIKQYNNAGRDDLSEKEAMEIRIIRQFLPEKMSLEEMQAHVNNVLSDCGLPLEISSMGQIMAVLKRDLQGRADMGEVSQYLRQKLQSA